jgi:hypothetical protein
MLVIMSYIDGIGNGFSWANTFLKMSTRPPLFCEPEHFSLNEQNLREILDKELQKWPEKETDDKPVAIWLLMGLQTAFPCSK